MHTITILVLTSAAAAAVHATHPAAGSAAARFWEEVLSGTPLPDLISDLVQKGIDHSPLQEDQRRNWVRVGGTMKVSLPAEVVPAILPRAVAEKLPFNNLADVLSLFNITPSSPAAAKINDTLSRCQAPDPAGEKKACATSLEGTVKTAVRMLLSTTSRPVWAVASKGLRANGRLPLQPYVIEAIRPLDGNRHVGCHVVTYPYAVYHCHTTGQPTKAYVVTLRGLREHGLGVQLAAICHLNTSTWNPAYPAFQMVHTRPGGVPVCHFMRIANLVFGEKAAKA